MLTHPGHSTSPLARSLLLLLLMQVEVPTDLVIRFVTNQAISTGDVVTLVLPGFGAARQDFSPTITSFSAFRRASWVCSLPASLQSRLRAVLRPDKRVAKNRSSAREH
jgi:hypothetical protein